MSETPENNKAPWVIPVIRWCNINNWTQPEYRELEGMWYAFPPYEDSKQPVPYFVDLCQRYLGRDNNL
jgi:hypothetical protein